MKQSQHSPAGYAAELPSGLAAAIHPGGALSLSGQDGHIVLQPEDVEALAALLGLAGGLRSQARRRRARAAYMDVYGSAE
ncbi:MAG TPA: hypothetical protein PKD53_26205 [Chloroflexaceae bacterium]|nr:hypothetical protein [Chloroflexaceae bacterium]